MNGPPIGHGIGIACLLLSSSVQPNSIRQPAGESSRLIPPPPLILSYSNLTMSARVNKRVISSAGSAGKKDEASVLRAVPMSTTWVLFITREETRRAVREWLAANCSAHKLDSVMPLKAKHSYAMMGSTRAPLDTGLTKPKFQAGGANILWSLADTYDPLSTGSFSPIPGSSVFSELESDSGSCFSPAMLSEMPCTPVVTIPLSDGEGRADNITRRLDYRGAHEEDAAEALRLEQLLETQRRDSNTQRPDRSGWWISTIDSPPESSGATTPTSDRAFNQPLTMDMCVLNELVGVDEHGW
ncbi:hypothetical protein FRC08_001956 [Ceratobasidium sp. 394]|nr:hypothetical protein FRC08_001956 [Ceratobasidium sp. 394]KAG9097583.1 hypothetical protein FS749_005951 [Ceratobasidium sp. UAMH 11750]